jgi:hypothetical protein
LSHAKLELEENKAHLAFNAQNFTLKRILGSLLGGWSFQFAMKLSNMSDHKNLFFFFVLHVEQA